MRIMKYIDLENHFYDKCLIEAFEKRSEPPFYRSDTTIFAQTRDIQIPFGRLLEILLEVGEKRISLMDRLGISTAVLSSSPGAEELDAQESVRTCRGINDTLYALTKEYPGRYLGSAILPVMDVPAACDELERCVKELGFISWQTHSNYGDSAPDDEVYLPLFKKAAELGVYVFIHPHLPRDERIKNLGFTVSGPVLGYTIDTAVTLVKMIVNGVFDIVPETKVVLGHLGEGLPFLLDRMDNRIKMLPNPLAKNEHGFKHYFRNNIWVATSGNMSKAAFDCTVSMLGIDRVVFGSDYPYEQLDEMVSFVADLPIEEADREKVCFKNAEALGAKVT